MIIVLMSVATFVTFARLLYYEYNGKYDRAILMGIYVLIMLQGLAMST